jgi:hypothetical protein
MRRLAIIVGMLAAVLSLGVRPGQTETIPDKPGAAPAPVPPPCTDGMPLRVSAKIISVVFHDSQAIIVISAGTTAGVTRGWIGHVLRGDSDDRLPGGEIQIVRVEKTLSVGKVRLTQDQLDANRRVKLTSP